MFNRCIEVKNPGCGCVSKSTLSPNPQNASMNVISTFKKIFWGPRVPLCASIDLKRQKCSPDLFHRCWKPLSKRTISLTSLRERKTETSWTESLSATHSSERRSLCRKHRSRSPVRGNFFRIFRPENRRSIRRQILSQVQDPLLLIHLNHWKKIYLKIQNLIWFSI